MSTLFTQSRHHGISCARPEMHLSLAEGKGPSPARDGRLLTPGARALQAEPPTVAASGQVGLCFQGCCCMQGRRRAALLPGLAASALLGLSARALCPVRP